jgi:hypothetical protein
MTRSLTKSDRVSERRSFYPVAGQGRRMFGRLLVYAKFGDEEAGKNSAGTIADRQQGVL